MFGQIKLYLALGLVAAFLALGGVALWYRGEAISATAEAASARQQLSEATEANKQANATIDALQEQSRMDSRLTASLVEEMRKVSDGLAEQSAKLTDLEKSNADIRNYLDVPVPTGLRELYHH